MLYNLDDCSCVYASIYCDMVSSLGVFHLKREHESLVKRGHRRSASLVPTEVMPFG